MGIYAGVNGVVRQVTQPRAGVNGAVRTVSHGFNSVNGTRRQFFGLLEDVARVEARVEYLGVKSIDSSGNFTEALTGNLTTLNQYGRLTASGTQLQILCNTIGKSLNVSGALYAVFNNGREVYLTYLFDSFARYGSAISFPVTYSIVLGHTSSSWRAEGGYICSCCGELYSGYVNESASGTKMALLNSADFQILSELRSGYGGPYQYVNLNFASGITIDGRTVPVKVVSELT